MFRCGLISVLPHPLFRSLSPSRSCSLAYPGVFPLGLLTHDPRSRVNPIPLQCRAPGKSARAPRTPNLVTDRLSSNLTWP